MLISTLSKSKWPMVESNHIYLFELNTIGGHLYRGTNLYHRNPPSPPSQSWLQWLKCGTSGTLTFFLHTPF